MDAGPNIRTASANIPSASSKKLVSSSASSLRDAVGDGVLSSLMCMVLLALVDDVRIVARCRESSSSSEMSTKRGGTGFRRVSDEGGDDGIVAGEDGERDSREGEGLVGEIGFLGEVLRDVDCGDRDDASSLPGLGVGGVGTTPDPTNPETPFDSIIPTPKELLLPLRCPTPSSL